MVMVRLPSLFAHGVVGSVVLVCGYQAVSGGGHSSRLARLPNSTESSPQAARQAPSGKIDLSRMEDRHRVAAEVQAGRLSLRDAVELFRTLNADLPPRMLTLLPGATPEERLCRQVINYSVEHDAHGRAANAEAVARLEEELACMLASGWPHAPAEDAP